MSPLLTCIHSTFNLNFEIHLNNYEKSWINYPWIQWAGEGAPHHFFVHTTNDVTTHHYFVRPHLFSSWRCFCLIRCVLWHFFQQRNWVFVTNSNFKIPISFQPDSVNLWYFKLRLFCLTEFIVWNIKGLLHHFAKI